MIQSTVSVSQKERGYKRLNLILGNEKVEQLKSTTVLLVGVGGIGCQVLKNLTKIPIKKIVIIDLDQIEISNLNRQFYFRTQHIGQSKSYIAAQQIKTLNPLIKIEPIYGNIYSSQYDNFIFYQQFDVVISALDSLKAREFLAKKCTEFGKLLIDAGTAGFHGQSYMSVRFLTSCHNCHSSVGNQENENSNTAVCTIRSRPTKSAHCAIYAKYIFQQLFTENIKGHIQQSLQQSLQFQPFLQRMRYTLFKDFESKQGKQLKIRIIELFDYLFSGQFKLSINSQTTKKDNQDQNQKIAYVTYEQAIKMEGVNVKQNIDLNAINQDTVLTIKQYAQLFQITIIKILQQKRSQQTKYQIEQFQENDKIIEYDKDNMEINLFICCVANLRVYNFMNFNKEQSMQQQKLKFMTLYEVRKIIGKIVPAIASTNAIAAALEVKQLVDIDLQFGTQKHTQSKLYQNSLKGGYESPKYYTISPYTSEKVSYSFLSLPNPQCNVCSPVNLYFHIVCNLEERTFEQFQQFAFQKCYSFNRDLYCGNMIIVKNRNADGSKASRQSPNKKKRLNFKPQLIVNKTLVIEFFPLNSVSKLKVKVILVHEQQLTKEDKQKQTKQEDKRYDLSKSLQKKKFRILNQKQIQQSIKKLQQLQLNGNNQLKQSQDRE